MLSKSDFKIASTCSKKLIYKKASFETMNDANEYIELLAQGGHIIAKYAQLIFPNGIEVKGETIDEAISETKKLIEQVQKGEISVEDITEALFENSLDTKGIPNPDLMIRTGGDHRISNFMLWQLAYSELFIFEDLSAGI